ncbi:hypothetical protein F8M41_001619 [Gigaspora margarita]|uniref:Uncharacterized protein n=1 Tax=Gigaspora margarita TaxID=4874 RepID=A0A8H4AYW1_GIGMA|nr:hypothetical protein F8M41_001619 [Gigaspora margarita]
MATAKFNLCQKLNNDEVNNLLEQLALEQLAGLYDEDSLEVKLNKTWKEAIELCRKESLATYEQISKFLTQAFYNDNSLEEYEPLLLIRFQVFEYELIAVNFIYKEKINKICNHSKDVPYNKIDKHKEPVEDFNRYQRLIKLTHPNFHIEMFILRHANLKNYF